MTTLHSHNYIMNHQVSLRTSKQILCYVNVLIQKQRYLREKLDFVKISRILFWPPILKLTPTSHLLCPFNCFFSPLFISNINSPLCLPWIYSTYALSPLEAPCYVLYEYQSIYSPKTTPLLISSCFINEEIEIQ